MQTKTLTFTNNNLATAKTQTPRITEEKAPKENFRDTETAANLAIAKINTQAVQTEEAPKFDYRAHSKGDALMHISKRVLEVAGGAVFGAQAYKLLAASILHHDIEKAHIHQFALATGIGQAVISGIDDAYDTIMHNGND